MVMSETVGVFKVYWSANLKDYDVCSCTKKSYNFSWSGFVSVCTDV